MPKNVKLPLVAVVLAIVVTTTMDFTGYTVFSALPLLGLTLAFWLIQRQTKAEIGLVLGSPRDYGLALSYPAVVLGLAVLVAFLAGALSPAETNWSKVVGVGILAQSAIASLMVLLTEEGFFRGWLWGAFRRAEFSHAKTLAITSLLFTAWHVSAVTSGTDYGLPWPQVPVYLANAMLLGLIWGLMRLISGSAVVASVSHAVWNSCAYTLFGFGTKVGALGITNTPLFGPEVGYLGLLLNGAFFLWLLAKARRSGSLEPNGSPPPSALYGTEPDQAETSPDSNPSAKMRSPDSTTRAKPGPSDPGAPSRRSSRPSPSRSRAAPTPRPRKSRP